MKLKATSIQTTFTQILMRNILKKLCSMRKASPQPFVSHFFSSMPSSTKSAFNFGLSSSNPDVETESPPKHHDDAATNKPDSSKPQVNLKPKKAKPQDSTSDTGYSTGNYIDLFALLDILENVSDTINNVDTIEKTIAEINTMIDEKVSGLDSKLDASHQSLSQTNKSRPTIAEQESHLDQLISLLLKNTIEEVE